MFNVFEILTIQQFLTPLYDVIYFIFSCNDGIQTQVLRLRIHNAKASGKPWSLFCALFYDDNAIFYKIIQNNPTWN